MSKREILILVGVPASGKSTYARKLANYFPNKWVIVSRDAIRNSLGTYWVPKREKLITRLEASMIINSLKAGYDVIVDATNLNPSTVIALKKEADRLSKQGIDVTVTFKEFEIPLWKAIWRDWRRGIFGRSVGVNVIKGFYKRYYKR